MNVIVFKLFLEIFEESHMLLLHRVRNFLVIQGFDRKRGIIRFIFLPFILLTVALQVRLPFVRGE